jgi:hypothetical protein
MIERLSFIATQPPSFNEPTLDRHFVQQIGQAFGSGGAVTPALVTIAVLVAVFCALALVLGRLWLRWRQRQAEAEPPVGMLADQASIREVLENALLHRSKVELSFHQKDERRRSIACALLEVGRTGLTLELPAGIMPGPSWVGRQVDGFFQIGQGAAAAKRKIFYHFSTVVSAVPKAGKHAAMLALALPDNIILSQKRAFLRMAPPSSAIPVFEILPADDATLRQCLAWLLPPPPPGEGQEPQPPATLPSLGRFKIKDISGGGGRVEARLADKEGQQRLSLAAGVGCYVALELQADPPRRYVLGATVRRVFRESAGVLDLGLEFTSRLKGLSPDTGLPVWKALKGKGDESIENWVVRKYLEIYRDKGVEPAA